MCCVYCMSFSCMNSIPYFEMNVFFLSVHRKTGWLTSPADFSCHAGLQLAPAPSSSALSKPERWQDALDSSILLMPRTKECFSKIQLDERLGYNLPVKNAIAGQVLKHCFGVVSRTISKFKPLIFKLGYTHDAYMRMYNRKFGYIHERDGWQQMVVLYAAGETISPAFLEAALIQNFKGSWDFIPTRF